MRHKITMLKTVLGCDDGVVIPTRYIEGQDYQIGDALLETFIDMGVVKLADAEPRAEAPVFDPLARETKIVAPEERKVVGPEETKDSHADE